MLMVSFRVFGTVQTTSIVLVVICFECGVTLFRFFKKYSPSEIPFVSAFILNKASNKTLFLWSVQRTSVKARIVSHRTDVKLSLWYTRYTLDSGFVKTFLMAIFRLREKKLTYEWRKLHDQELQNIWFVAKYYYYYYYQMIQMSENVKECKMVWE